MNLHRQIVSVIERVQFDSVTIYAFPDGYEVDVGTWIASSEPMTLRSVRTIANDLQKRLKCRLGVVACEEGSPHIYEIYKT